MNLFAQQQQEFSRRHIGPNEAQTAEMLQVIGISTIDELIEKTVPSAIRLPKPLNIPNPMSEAEYLRSLKTLSLNNKVARNFIGQGYYGTLTPSVILRNLFENPGWYTAYTPYQAEIAQGRLESLLNYQTMVSDLTGLPIANASLLDEGTAAAEAMSMFFHFVNKGKATKTKLFVDNEVFPQTKQVLYTRALPLGIEVVYGDYKTATLTEEFFGAIVQYPNAAGSVEDYTNFIESVHAVGGKVAVGTDLLALTLIATPGEMGADVAYGNSQRFGVPLGFGGPHAAFFTCKEEFTRNIPGRIIGVSIDAEGKRALRMALQTREQHIKREKATSNICTAQALLANMAAMYAVYHGPEGLKNIAKRVNVIAQAIATELKAAGHALVSESFFDTVTIKTDKAQAIREKAEAAGINFRYFEKDGASYVGIAIDETANQEDVADIINAINLVDGAVAVNLDESKVLNGVPANLVRTSPFLTHPNFNSYHSESLMMRYLKSLENKDLSLNSSMITLGSCTMKLNAATEMMPLSWAHFSSIHPFAPADQVKGYVQMATELEAYLSEITGFDACSLQPNSGASGEYAGLLAFRGYHESRGEGHRNIILIPISAHGTNPASAAMAGYKVVVVKALENGNIDVADMKAKAEQYSNDLAGVMITYPSTYGIFEESVKEIIDIIHANGGQVYMDGANMNAQVGLTAPGFIGADVCHLNLHKTFAIPHGGGGPGVGPICVKSHLAPFLPSKLDLGNGHDGSVASALYGSASILLISYAYIKMLGAEGLKKATQYAILNANYMKARLEKDYDILYSGANGTCAHEFIVDLRPLKKTAGVEAVDVAKRLMDYGFHAPTMSFPVAGTIMIEPTESEDKGELDRFCDAMLAIREEIRAIENGTVTHEESVMKNAPHTQAVVINSNWDRKYTREQAAFPLPYVAANKFWPTVSRINDTHGDRNLICTCEPIESYMEVEA